VDLEAVARACGIEKSCTVRTLEDFTAAVERLLKVNELAVLVAKVATEPEYKRRNELPSAPETTFTFARHIEQLEGRPILSASSSRR
jgi:thiamine pyrophosphate-dependent acetolactate synthase large subunit-like protein